MEHYTGTNIRSQNQVIQFDLGLTELQSTTHHCTQHVQRQTELFEFDLSLTKTQSSTKTHARTMCGDKLIIR